MNDAIARVEAAVRRSVDAGDPNAVAMWNRTGGSECYDRRRRWWTDHNDEFAAALLTTPAPGERRPACRSTAMIDGFRRHVVGSRPVILSALW